MTSQYRCVGKRVNVGSNDADCDRTHKRALVPMSRFANALTRVMIVNIMIHISAEVNVKDLE